MSGNTRVWPSILETEGWRTGCLLPGGGSWGLESSCGSVSNINIFVGSWEPRAGLGLRHAGNTHSESGPGLVREWAVGDRAGRGECAGHARGYDSLGSMTLIQFSSEHRRASSSNSITVISPPVLRCPLERSWLIQTSDARQGGVGCLSHTGACSEMTP